MAEAVGHHLVEVPGAAAYVVVDQASRETVRFQRHTSAPVPVDQRPQEVVAQPREGLLTVEGLAQAQQAGLPCPLVQGPLDGGVHRFVNYHGFDGIFDGPV